MNEFTTPHAIPGEPAAPCGHPGRDGYCDTAGCWCQRNAARAIAGPVPGREPDLDQLASAIAYGVLLAAFAEYGITRRAVRAAQLAVIGSDAFETEGSANASPHA